MFTKDSLIAVAELAEAKYNERIEAGFGVGTYDKERNDARRLVSKAMAAAVHMEQNGIESAVAVGEFCTVKLNKGDRVRIKAGAKIWGTHPQYRNGGRHISRSRVVSVWRLDEGYTPAEGDVLRHTHALRNPQVCWVGTGGYWFYADVNDVEIL